MRGLSNLIPFKGRSVGLDRITILTAAAIALSILVTPFGFIPTAFAVTAATVTVPATTPVSANSATTNITGISVGGLASGTTYLVAIGMTNFPSGAVLRLNTTTGLTASYGFTSGSNTFTSFTNISFRGSLTDVNNALASLRYISGASGASNPSIRVTATSYDAGYSLNGINGHYYKSSTPTTATYTQARTNAKATSYKGMPGYLVAITSEAENSFVATNIESAASVWIGATDEVTEGTWKWDTDGGSPEAGTTFWSGAANGSAVGGNYQSWNPGSEPNDASGEDYAVTNWGGSSNGRWNDCNNNGCGASRLYVIEYGNNTPDAGFVNANSDLGSATFSLSYTPILTGTTNTLSTALGNIVFETVTATAGTGNKTLTLSSSPSNSGITIDTSTTNRAVLRIGNTVGAGTYTSTITATDAAGITATYIVTTTVSNPSSSETDSAISLNGSSQYLSAAGTQVIPTSTSATFTVEAWIFPANNSVPNSVIVSQGPNGGRFYLKRSSDGIVRFFREGHSAESSCGAVPIQEWTHVAVVIGNSASKCYINGGLVLSNSFTSSTSIGTGFMVGQYTLDPSNAAYYFAGQIDEVKIWSSDRSASISDDLKTYGGTLANGLVAYYDFNELVGTRVVNRSTGGSSALDLISTGTPTIISTSIIETSTVQAYTVVKFMRSFLVASGGWKTPANRQLRVFAVGGGGGGGFNSGGGGSGGGYLATNYSANLETVSVIVGVGGSGAGPVTTPATRTTARNGTNSSFGSSSAVGGNYGYNTLVNGAVGGAAVNGFGKGGNASTSSSSSNHATAGSAGVTSNITGNNLNYGGGGGGGGWNADNLGGTGGAGGGGNGSGSNLSVPTNGTANLGGGGGGSRQNNQIAANGGSGVVIIAYINNAPTILIQPLSDTTTAGIVETFTVTTSAAPAPLTKSVQWQFTTDTATGVTGWTNVSSGTGGTTDTFTTVALTTSMNRYWFRAIITFSDTSTLSVTETTTAVILTINPAITITSDTSTITRKYGDTQTVRTLVYSGGTTNTGTVGTSTSHTVRGSFGTQASGRIVLDTSTTTAVFRVDTGTVVGSYVETITVTDAKGATATYTQRVVVNQADTLTVQADTLTAITFGATLNPTVTVTGLKSGDTVASATFSNVSCANGGLCAIGDIGPGGGVVFYLITNMSDSQTAIAGYTSGGIYLEAAPVGWGNGIAVSAGETTGTSYLDPVVNWCNTALDFNSKGAAIGLGGDNSKKMDTNCSSGAGQIAVDLNIGGKDDWYLPSQDELTQMGVQKNLIGLLYGVNNCYGSTCYWSSTQNGGGSSVRALQVSAGSQSMGNNDTLLTASNKVMMRPIRAFSPITNNTETVTAGAPTAAGTYSLRPTAITLAGGVNTNNYVAIIYRSSPVTINRAVENPRISMQQAKVAYDTGTATQALTATSGAGTGAIFYMIGAGSAAGCSISGSTVRSTSDGVCNVIAFKQVSTNYLADSATAVTITFTRFVERVLQVQLYPSMIPLNQGNALETNTVTAATLTISAITRTGAGAYTITGTGFTNIDLVSIGGAALSGSNYTRVSSTTLTLSGVSSFMGPLLIRLADGQESVLFQFDWS